MAQTVDLRLQGVRFMAGTVTLDGSNPTSVDLTGQVSQIVAAGACLGGTAATGADPNQVSVDFVTSAGRLDIHAWKVTTGGASGNPTEVASTDSARVINWWAWGLDLQMKGR